MFYKLNCIMFLLYMQHQFTVVACTVTYFMGVGKVSWPLAPNPGDATGDLFQKAACTMYDACLCV